MRIEESVAFRLLRELRQEDQSTFRHWLRLSEEQKKDTNMRQAVTAAERLSLPLR